MAKRTAGNLYENPKTPLKTASEIAVDVEKAAATEKFPAKLTDATALLRKTEATEVNSQEDWETLQPILIALRLHVHKLQQGLPVLESKSTDFNHVHMRNVMQDMQLKTIIRTNPLVKDLLAERDALKKENEKLKAALNPAAGGEKTETE